HRVAEAEGPGELIERLLVGLDVHQHVVRLVHLGERIGELAPTPVLQTVHAAAAGGNHALIALDHRGHLLALIRMHQEYDLVMPHSCAPCGFEPPGLKTLPVRQGDTRRARCARRGAYLLAAPIGRGHVRTPLTVRSRMPAYA